MLTCGSSGPRHSPPEPPSSPPPTGATWSRDPSPSWVRPEGEKTQGEGRGENKHPQCEGGRPSPEGIPASAPGHTPHRAEAGDPHVSWTTLGIWGGRPAWMHPSLYKIPEGSTLERRRRAEKGFVDFTSSSKLTFLETRSFLLQ